MLHAYILSGGESGALFRRATELAALALCERPKNGAPCRACRHCRKVFAGIHPDVTAVERLTDDKGRPRREITVEQIRRLDADAAVLPNEAERKVYILREADAMNASAQNAFLKLLEEPPSFVVFLLCAENAALLLPTVRSRCALVRAAAGEAEPPEAARERAGELLDCLGDPPALLRCCARLEKLDGAEARELVEALRLLAPERLAPGAELLALERELETADAWLKANVGVKHVLGVLATYSHQK